MNREKLWNFLRICIIMHLYPRYRNRGKGKLEIASNSKIIKICKKLLIISLIRSIMTS